MDSKQVVDALFEVDPGFEQLCKTLFGDLVEPAAVWDFMYEQDGISKMAPVTKAMPDQVDLATKGGRLLKVLRKHGPTAAGGVVIGSGGTLVATKSRDKKGKILRFDSTGMHEVGKAWRMPSKTSLKAAGIGIGTGVIANQLPQQGRSTQEVLGLKKVAKADAPDVVWQGTFSKTDEDKHQAFGWASVVEIDGKPVIDRQGDWITPDEIEKAAYQYVLENRRGGHQHRRDEQDRPLQASSLIESFVVTPEKIEKMGLPESTPLGWWVGYKVHDDEAWDKIKKGDVTGFSIHGKGKRRDVEEVDKAITLKRPPKVATLHSSLKPTGLTGWDDVPAPVTTKVARAKKKKWEPALGAPRSGPSWVGEHRW